MSYRYFEWEDRLYRAPKQDLRQLEKQNSLTGRWEPYLGDAARVIAEATHLDRPPTRT